MIVWLASYPKSGNTFLRSLLATYFFTEDGNFDFNILKTIKQFPVYPLFKKIGVNVRDENEVIKNYVKAQELFNKPNTLQFVKTHSCLLKGFTNYKNSLGVIYVVRDPRNVAISAANHFNTSIEKSVERLITNTSLLGDVNKEKQETDVQTHLTTWSLHYKSWKIFEKRKKYLLIKYEDLTQNTEKVFKIILDFIYELNNQKYILNQYKMENLLKTTSFENMQKIEKEKNFIERAKHGDIEKTFFKYGPNSNKKELLGDGLREKIEHHFKEEMSELNYL